MICECGQREATIHEVTIQNGTRVERHLCEQCASKLGVSTDPHVPISQLISNYIMGKNMAVPSVGSEDKRKPTKGFAPASVPCVSCGMGFKDFKEHGLTGCPSCYESFKSRLGPLIARAHEGGEQHIGKVPRRALSLLSDSTDPKRLENLIGGASEREQRLEHVRTQLAAAVRHEDYEHAALLRDELTRIASMPMPKPGSQVEPTSGAREPSATRDD
jgi:protein arginine kinase activator